MVYRRKEHPPEWYCGARKTDASGKTCRMRAGYRTGHLGYGRCYLHGGATPIKHGFYSKWVSQMLADRIGDAEGLSALQHAEQALIAQAGFITLYTSRCKEGIELTREDIDFIQKWLARVVKTAETVSKIRYQQAPTVGEVLAMFEGWARIVEKYIDDPHKREALGKELRDYVGSLGSGTLEEERGQDRRPALPSPEQG